MGTTALRQLLKSLCKSSHWKYAVFWKLKHENPMILTWEDGYCDYPKPGECTERISDDIYFNGGCEMIPSNSETSLYHGTSGGYPIGLAVADMSCLQYRLGEGVIGKVAFMGNHCWISSDCIFAGELNSKLVSENPDQWLLQFTSGIKTVLLVPLLPHGVLQLGSLEKVVEDEAVVSHLKDRFNMLRNDIGNISHFTLDRDFQDQLLPLSSPQYSANFRASKLEIQDRNSIEDVKPNKTELLSPFHIVPQGTIEGIFEFPETDLRAEILGSANNCGVLPTDFVGVSSPLDQPIYASQEMIESKLFAMSCLEEELQAFSHYNVSRESSNNNMNSYVDGHMEVQPLADMDFSDIDYQNVSSFLNFPMDCELHKALGPGFQRQKNEYLFDSFLLVDGTNNVSELMCNRNLIDGTETESSLFPKGCDPESLLEAMVDNVNSSDSNDASLGQCVPSSQPQCQSEASPSGEDSVPQSHVTNAFTFRGRNAFTSTSASHSLGSMISTLINDEKQKKGSSEMQPRKGAKLSNVSKRRTRSGDNPKPRPRDRQMIQDRVKELRELVPDGGKCSIDGLLDKTIKHMMFLRSVTDRAEKLSKWVGHEVAEHRRSYGTNSSSCQSGTSWALEFNSELQVCPIVVEDLECPGHMLIEMLCDDHGLFLEIAQVIRGLELTIIKGTMETHSNNTWAHFIVEASKGFHRMDIFWPLMQFLQRKRNPISSKI